MERVLTLMFKFTLKPAAAADCLMLRKHNNNNLNIIWLQIRVILYNQYVLQISNLGLFSTEQKKLIPTF